MTISLITNVTRYAGPEAARALLACGHSVVGHDASFDQPELRAGFTGQFAGALPSPVTDPARCVEAVVAEQGGLDVLICNQFVLPENQILEETSADQFQDILNALLMEPYRFLAAAVPHLKTSRGRAILVTSAAALRPGARGSLYAAARSGATALVKSLSRELGPHGVSVFGIAPNYFASDDTYSRDAFANDAKYRTRIQRQVPLKRLSSEGEMGRLVAFLANDESAFLTGEVFQFTGGW